MPNQFDKYNPILIHTSACKGCISMKKKPSSQIIE